MPGWLLAAASVLALCLIMSAGADEEFDDPSISVKVEAPVLITSDLKIGQVVKLADGSLFVSGFRSDDGGRTWAKASDALAGAFTDEWRQGQQAVCVLRTGEHLGLGMFTEMPSLTEQIVKVYTWDGKAEAMEGPIDAPLDHPQGTGGYVESGEHR